MSDAAPAKSPKKKAAKPKKPATHPKYSEMIKAAISALKDRGGSSRQAILKHIMKNNNVGKVSKGQEPTMVPSLGVPFQYKDRLSRLAIITYNFFSL